MSWILRRFFGSGPDPREEARLEAARILEHAEQDAKAKQLEAQEEALRLRKEVEAEDREQRRENKRLEERTLKREETLDARAVELDRRDQRLHGQQQTLDEREGEIAQQIGIQQQRLEEISQLTVDEARERMLSQLDDEVRDEANRRVRQAEARAKEESEDRARKVIATAIQRVASEVTSESTVTVIKIPNDEMKGRIIGREGRNIRALEAATGCDLIIDDTPDVVTMSAFDPVRREIGRLSLSRLVADGRIHPARIEEQVAKVTSEVETLLRQAGEEAAIEAKCPGMPKELLHIFGRLRYRTSYGQNQLRHAVETAHIAAMLAEEMNSDVDVVRRGALLHDLGKAVDHEVEGTHALIGGDIARRFKVPESVVHCIEAHHEEVELHSVEAVIVQMADAISGGRPGARRESAQNYVERLRALEEIADSFPGVERAFAIQAGREMRVLVNPERVDDLEAMRMARDISKKIEENLQYPGQIRVTVMRETRATEIAG